MTVENATRECPMADSNNSLARCDQRWDQVPPDGLLVSANFSDPWGILYVKPGEGEVSDIDGYTVPIPLTVGSHLAAILDMTERDVFSNTALDYFGITTPLRKFVLRPVLLLQEDRMPPNSGSDTVSLRLRPRADNISVATKVVQDYTDVSVLNGLATFGGFWTFMNGGFALFFGANIVYFLYKTRALSALGLVHWFQRRALLRQWHEDFPALRTEGGQPGSETAGIVAFIRERLVDVEDERPKQEDSEPQNTPSGKRYRWISATQLALVEIDPKKVEKRGRTSKETSDRLDEEDRHLDETLGFQYLAGIS
ncbi:Short-chain dehydrogenase/reductase family protein [Mycena venus]|uniref:Short-chain dehydrogenase/reductase family protein n=1 Tax=Mycena venus TaxID=2733690 RepID=A0A8H6U2Y0_9AGAR|nr:Short-chain dehydrogenase/reductase family protein [Mycena venus]